MIWVSLLLLYICKLTFFLVCTTLDFQFYARLKLHIFINKFTGKRLEFDKISARICVNNPLFHAYGTAISIMVAVNHGSCLFLPSPHFSPQRSLEMIASEKCNVIYGTPTSECVHAHVRTTIIKIISFFSSVC